MNLFTELLLIFVFIYVLIIYKFPNTATDNYILQKLAFFILLFCFYFVIQMINLLYNGCKINMHDVLLNCLYVAVSGVLGYTLYVDLSLMSCSKEQFNQYISHTSPYMSALMITLSITLFITFVKVIALLFTTSTITMGLGDTCSTT